MPRTLYARPFGMNALIEASSRRYHQQMVEWVSIALEEGVRFFITSLGLSFVGMKRSVAAGLTATSPADTAARKEPSVFSRCPSNVA